MRENLTEMVFVLDRSGSMRNLTADTIGGFNELIEKQNKLEGDAYVTTVLFDHEYELLHDHVALKDVAPLTDREYFARGSTALLDAVGRTINTIGARLAATPEEERPAHVVFAITTDGMERSSISSRSIPGSSFSSEQTWTPYPKRGISASRQNMRRISPPVTAA